MVEMTQQPSRNAAPTPLRPLLQAQNQCMAFNACGYNTCTDTHSACKLAQLCIKACVCVCISGPLDVWPACCVGGERGGEQGNDVIAL